MPDGEKATDSFCALALVFDVLRQREVELVSMPFRQGVAFVLFGEGRYYDGSRADVSRRRVNRISQQVHAQLAILTGDLPSVDGMSPSLRGADLHLTCLARPLLLNSLEQKGIQLPCECKGTFRFRVSARRVEWVVGSPTLIFRECVTVE